MNLILDWGNTRQKVALFDGKKVCFTKSFTNINENDFKSNLLPYTIHNIILSSVVALPKWLKEYVRSKNGLHLSHKTILPITLNYETPESLGHDRVANAVAAQSLYPMQSSLCIDFGTCIKYDFIDDESTYQGGSISPGLTMRFQALNTFTDKLPLVKSTILDDFLGKSTQNAIASGVYFGIIEEVNGIINRYKTRFSNLNVIITGGDVIYFEKALKKPIFAHSFLTLYGLNEILLHNAK